MFVSFLVCLVICLLRNAVLTPELHAWGKHSTALSYMSDPQTALKEDSNTIISEQEPIFGSNKIWLNKHAEITMLHHVLQKLEP